MAAVLLGLAALIHLLPLPGVGGRDALKRLYGVEIEGPELLLAMRHRALMFGVLGLGLLASIAWPSLRAPVIIATLVSDVGFLGLAWGHHLNSQMKRVVVADVLSILALIGALSL